ncbi:uncharacterized protein MKK02DRAFT_30600 [Dioszegia hungarica]|uniref:Uncharacterized protein n=1 Tax=Dioszegia hungarica TaxID=4972 RepID=A0AA38H2U3_9TREE|nr:uncharacterized protein MKK02DRAFT_30600 [Dioszegia hungarica]KAI9632872.1 hypothetical protein MKK02DRAFT_30600 [Dioszegia hungarica]
MRRTGGFSGKPLATSAHVSGSLTRRQIEVAPAKRRSNVQYSPLDTFRVGQAAGPSDSASKVSIHPNRSRPSGTATRSIAAIQQELASFIVWVSSELGQIGGILKQSEDGMRSSGGLWSALSEGAIFTDNLIPDLPSGRLACWECSTALPRRWAVAHFWWPTRRALWVLVGVPSDRPFKQQDGAIVIGQCLNGTSYIAILVDILIPVEGRRPIPNTILSTRRIVWRESMVLVKYQYQAGISWYTRPEWKSLDYSPSSNRAPYDAIKVLRLPGALLPKPTPAHFVPKELKQVT